MSSRCLRSPTWRNVRGSAAFRSVVMKNENSQRLQKGPGSAGRLDCAGLAKLLEEVDYLISRKWANRVHAFLWAFLPSFLSVSMFFHPSLVFRYLSFLFIFVSFFLPFSPSILVILLWGHSYFLSLRLYCLLSPHPHRRLPLFFPWFLSCSPTRIHLFSFVCFFILSLFFLSFSPFSFPPPFLSFPLIYFIVSISFPLISLFTFLYPFPGPPNFPLFSEVGIEPAGGSPPPESDLSGYLAEWSWSPVASQPEQLGLFGDNRPLGSFSVKSVRLRPGLTGKCFGQNDGRVWELQEQRVEAQLIRRRPLSLPCPSHPVSPATSLGLGPSQDKRKCFRR